VHVSNAKCIKHSNSRRQRLFRWWGYREGGYGELSPLFLQTCNELWIYLYIEYLIRSPTPFLITRFAPGASGSEKINFRYSRTRLLVVYMYIYIGTYVVGYYFLVIGTLNRTRFDNLLIINRQPRRVYN